jgi:hypothetical protein
MCLFFWAYFIRIAKRNIFFEDFFQFEPFFVEKTQFENLKITVFSGFLGGKQLKRSCEKWCFQMELSRRKRDEIFLQSCFFFDTNKISAKNFFFWDKLSIKNKNYVGLFKHWSRKTLSIDRRFFFIMRQLEEWGSPDFWSKNLKTS